MPYVALVTLLLVSQYLVFVMLCAQARDKSGLKAPAVTGDQNFERAFRVQMNTVEQLLITLPAMWVCAIAFKPWLAAVLGLVFFAGRLLYRNAYVRDPESRGTGMMIGFLANIVLLLTAFWGVLRTL